jgi:hypothetical protein
MTFEEFQATRIWAHDLVDALGPDIIYQPGRPGFHYKGGLHIFAPGGGAATNVYELVIGNEQTLSEDLTELERKLYEYGLSEGSFD